MVSQAHLDERPRSWLAPHTATGSKTWRWPTPCTSHGRRISRRLGKVVCVLDALAKKKDASYTVQQAHYLIGTLIHDEACVRFQARDHEDEPHKLKKRYEAYVVIVSVFYDVQDSLKPLLARRAVKFAANVLEAIHYLGELATLRPGQPIWSEGVKALQEVWHSYPGANYG
jgi:hypothetical protein